MNFEQPPQLSQPSPEWDARGGVESGRVQPDAEFLKCRNQHAQQNVRVAVAFESLQVDVSDGTTVTGQVRRRFSQQAGFARPSPPENNVVPAAGSPAERS